MASRRAFLAGLAAAGLTGTQSWAMAGTPKFLSCGALPNGQYVLCGLSEVGHVLFSIPLPARGHAGAAHPERAEAVVFARRPGNFAIVVDCIRGTSVQALRAPMGRHFYGHGTFSADGSLLFTTENAFDEARGIIGVWDVRRKYRRVGEFDSGGIGPHEIMRMPDSEKLVVANGGIETHPDSGRTKLNIPTMDPNLVYFSSEGSTDATLGLPISLRKNSIRHIDVSSNQTVAFGMQWQGDKSIVQPSIGTASSSNKLALLDEAHNNRDLMAGYVGSIAISRSGERVCATSPRANNLTIRKVSTGRLSATHNLPDVCGIGTIGECFFATYQGGAARICDREIIPLAKHEIRWDNHLTSV